MFILRQEWPLLHLVNKEFQEFLNESSIESELEFIHDNFGYDLKVGDTLIEINPWY